MKKYVFLFLCAVLALCGLTACQTAEKADGRTANDRVSVVATIFPEYDWVRQIAGENDNVDIAMLLDNGVDIHSYQPAVDDIVRVSTCDLFIYVGGESDGWVEDALSEAANPDMKVINLLDVLGGSVKEEEIVEGMEHEHVRSEEDGGFKKPEHEHDESTEHEHEHDDESGDTQELKHYHEDTGANGTGHGHDESDDHNHDHEHEDEECPEYDEHVWLSLKNAQVICTAIADALSEIDPANSESYAENVSAYNEKLAALDASYEAAARAGAKDTLLFGDRFPFRYMMDDYGLDYYAAFAGCSAESEASFMTIVFLADKVDELGLEYVIQTESSDGRIAGTIIENTENKDQKILTLNSMQSASSDDVEGGADYLFVMEENLKVLKEALK